MDEPEERSAQGSRARDRVARDRDSTSDSHDRTSEDRDARSNARDDRADAREKDDHFESDAAIDRSEAKRDRMSSATDRQHSVDDRHAASADRSRAARERSALVVDGLTGAHAREPGLAELRREIVKANRTEEAFVLAFIDVDNLKVRNDEHGHSAGDALLKHVAEAVRGIVREYDLIVRYGGDEFLCGIANMELDEAAERFESARMQLAASQNASYTVGLAELSPGEEFPELIVRADKAMYEARRVRSGAPRG